MAEILVEKDSHTVLIRLNRPEVHNAINLAMMQQLEDILTELEQSPEIVTIILTGSGEKSFCSGGDLKYFATLNSREAARGMSRRMQGILNRFYLGERVVIAAVNGLAYGGGCEVLTACHIRLAVPEATFSFRQAANGVTTGWGGGARLMQQLGASRALPLLLTSHTYAAREMQKIGFVQEVVSREELLSRAQQIAREIASNSHEAVRGYLQLFRAYQSHFLSQLADVETDIFANLWMGSDFRNWMEAFLTRKNNSAKKG